MAVGLDIGTLLFRDILRMYDYPGAPFTGDIIRDLIVYFFVPTVFLIVIIFFSTGIVLGPAWRGLRLLFGLAAYLFVIVSGYFSVFAYIAGPYFMVLVVIVGIVYFLLRHFRPHGLREGGAPPPGVAMPRDVVERNIPEARKRLQEIDGEIIKKKRELNTLAGLPGGDKAAGIVREEIGNLEREKYALERVLNPLKKYF